MQISTGNAKHLLRPDCELLQLLGARFVFEIAVGVNGGLWLRASGKDSERVLVILRNALQSAEELDTAQVMALVDRLAAVRF